ncbi:hypothetical protein IC229_34275 [Spirosoma sp. BT702]|uniref:Uncharacterized protein n=1 Tax=Spirosoma profusum TaxID=2771354 RepID=A0A927AWH1_9BACT|nr:hypothetical protein [Spirosoma profusum]MBD2705725.1 hypothetical protein [Spirosoma profusum]
MDITKSNPDNEFYMMNYSADFGVLRSHNLSIIMEDFDIKELKDIDSDRLIGLIREKYFKYDNNLRSIMNSLLDLCNNKNDKIHLSFLDFEDDTKDRQSQYERYLKRAFESAQVSRVQDLIARQERSTDALLKLINEVKHFKEVHYIDFSQERLKESKDESSIKQSFINELFKQNSDNYKRFKQYTQNTQLLDRIPFQFIVTKPKGKKVAGDFKNQSCLITFSNLEAIGENAGVYAFQSSDQRVVDNLVDIYRTYANLQKDKRNKNSSWDKFKSLVDLGSERVLQCVLKFKSINEEHPEFRNIISLSDFQAAARLQHLFEQEKVYLPELNYHSVSSNGREIVAPFSENFFTTGTYFGVGLFSDAPNELTLNEYMTKNYFSNLFTMVRSNENHSNILRVKGREFGEIWREDNQRDYGLIAKLRCEINSQNVTLFILGGINHFGTERVADYLYKHWQSLSEKTDGMPFLGVYEFSLSGADQYDTKEELFYVQKHNQDWVKV